MLVCALATKEVLSLKFWVLRFARRRYQLDAVSPLTSHLSHALPSGPSFFSFSWLVSRGQGRERRAAGSADSGLRPPGRQYYLTPLNPLLPGTFLTVADNVFKVQAKRSLGLSFAGDTLIASLRFCFTFML